MRAGYAKVLGSVILHFHISEDLTQPGPNEAADVIEMIIVGSIVRAEEAA